jgi:hypothetical protein
MSEYEIMKDQKSIESWENFEAAGAQGTRDAGQNCLDFALEYQVH